MLQRKQIRLPKQQIDKLDKLQEQTGYTHSELIRRALDEYFEKMLERGGENEQNRST